MKWQTLFFYNQNIASVDTAGHLWSEVKGQSAYVSPGLWPSPLCSVQLLLWELMSFRPNCFRCPRGNIIERVFKCTQRISSSVQCWSQDHVNRDQSHDQDQSVSRLSEVKTKSRPRPWQGKTESRPRQVWVKTNATHLQISCCFVLNSNSWYPIFCISMSFSWWLLSSNNNSGKWHPCSCGLERSWNKFWSPLCLSLRHDWVELWLIPRLSGSGLEIKSVSEADCGRWMDSTGSLGYYF